RPPGFSPFRVD
nr:RecName: Full=Bradykinin-like peptide RD-11 [Ascaphus truei]